MYLFESQLFVDYPVPIAPNINTYKKEETHASSPTASADLGYNILLHLLSSSGLITFLFFLVTPRQTLSIQTLSPHYTYPPARPLSVLGPFSRPIPVILFSFLFILARRCPHPPASVRNHVGSMARPRRTPVLPVVPSIRRPLSPHE